MRLLYNIEALASVPGPTHLAIGVFDGVHLGHQAVIGQSVQNARRTGGSAVVVTFDPHPVRVLRPEKAPRLLMDPGQKQRMVERLGADAMLTITFTHEFSKTPPALFIQQLHNSANGLREICVGEGWRFGADRSGEIGLLASIAQNLGIRLNAVSSVQFDGKTVSSTWVRAALDRRDLNEASQLLGRPFALLGRVPRLSSTANRLDLAAVNSQPSINPFPPDGIYAVKTDGDRRGYRAAVNIGWGTGGEQRNRLVQLRILGPGAKIAGGEMELSLLDYLRPKTSAGGFTEQIARDALWAKEMSDMESRAEEGAGFCEVDFGYVSP
jgi:riboflavin kinase / FMN adenylyltransferase